MWDVCEGLTNFARSPGACPIYDTGGGDRTAALRRLGTNSPHLGEAKINQ